MGLSEDHKLKWCFLSSRPPVTVNRMNREETVDHPLKTIIMKNEIKNATRTKDKEDSASTSKIIDPLTSVEGSDPLSLMAAEMDWDMIDSQIPVQNPGKEYSFKQWTEQRTFILNKFTTSQKLSMSTSFLSGDKSTKIHNPVVQHRLEQLDDFEEGSIKVVGQLTQQQYVESINQLNQELVQAWNQDFRVKALKIAIQCSKLLVDTSVIQFYPSKFVLITDVLDIFGSLVFERLKAKAECQIEGSRGGGLPENFTCDMVPESAKETCRNWFYKIASIRELVPRLYVEAAILKSYSFLTNREFSQALSRLTNMVRGIGDPLVAVYARCYLCRIGMSVSTSDKSFLKENFFDFLAVYDQIYGKYVLRDLNRQKVDLQNYLVIYEPALDWILQGLSDIASPDFLNQIIDSCAKKKNNGLLIHLIMTNFKPNYIASRSDFFVNLIGLKNCTEELDVSQIVTLLISLGECLQNHLVENPSIILEKAWKQISKLTNTTQFISCAQAWALFIVKNFSHVQVNKFLGDIIAHIGYDSKNYCQTLQSIILTIVVNVSNVESIFLMDKLLPALDLFDSEASKVTVCRKILEMIASKQGFTCTDPVTTVTLIFLAKILHDSVNAFTVEDEKKQIGTLISRLIKQISFGMDFEKQLNFYVEARGTFTNIDLVLSTLVQCVNNLAAQTGRIVKCHHTRKTASFVRACSAYCYITIPSISSEIIKLQLYLLTAQVSLFNQCLGQADACVKAALSQCLELPSSLEMAGEMKSTEPFLQEYTSNMLSTLIVVPDCSDQGAVYLTRGLVNMLSHYTNDQNAGTIAYLFLKVVDMLATSCQSVYPYHVKNVDSNDVFYGSDPKFISEINKMCSVVVEEILNYLKILGSNNHYNKQGKLSFELFVRVILYADLEVPEMAMLAVNLWRLANKHNALDSKFVKCTIKYLQNRYDYNAYKEVLGKLIQINS